MKSRKFLMIIIPLAMVIGLVFAGCGGSDGSDGKSAYEIAVDNGYTGTEEEWVASLASVPVEGEACVICHEGAGEHHQALYDDFLETDFEVSIVGVSATAMGTSPETWDTTIDFTVTEGGVAYDEDGLASLQDDRGAQFQLVQHDAAAGFVNPDSDFGDVINNGGGSYSVLATNVAYDVTVNGAAIVYFNDGELWSPGGRVTLYDDWFSDGSLYGTAATYVSPANVYQCEDCHSDRYGKHGYRPPLTDFVGCKNCHYDDRTGGHPDWQQLVDNPLDYANGVDPSETLYGYIANVKNDVHMSHAMEFPYPRSMADCVACHENKLDMILTDANFNLATCKSCHAVTGDPDYPPHQAPPLFSIMPTVGLDHTTYIDADYQEANTCNGCHNDGGAGPDFSEVHPGYISAIYSDENVKWSDDITVSVDGATWDPINYDLTFDISAQGSTEIVPEVLIGLYGWDTNQMIVNGHDRYDSNGNGTIGRNEDAEGHDWPKLAFEPDQVGHLYFTVDLEAADAWTITAHLAEWADLFEDGTVRRVEITVLPTNDQHMALNAATKTYDIDADTLDDPVVIADADKCNACHGALGTTFHSPYYGGNITVCKQCHVTLTGGSHLEMQSRAIDSYVHAIHQMAPFDYGRIDFDDPVEEVHYEHHIEAFYPKFGTIDCESCHVEGAYDVPDQTKSLPGVLSASSSNDTRDRSIGDVPEYVTGPASRACGGCHRTMAINENNANELAAFNAHVAGNGYLVENDSNDNIFYAIVDKVMSLFN
jgi:OmcA/MtrC family decaheme c-type cytochrome